MSCTFLDRSNVAGTQKCWCPQQATVVVLISKYSLPSVSTIPFNTISESFKSGFTKAWNHLNILNLNSYLNSFQKWAKTKADSLSRDDLLPHKFQSPKEWHGDISCPSLPTQPSHVVSLPFKVWMILHNPQPVMFPAHKGRSKSLGLHLLTEYFGPLNSSIPNNFSYFIDVPQHLNYKMFNRCSCIQESFHSSLATCIIILESKTPIDL